MQICLTIDNADDKLLKALKSVIKLYPNAKLKTQKKQKLTINGYTPEFEASILKEAEHMKKNPHLYKSYSSIDEMFKDLESE